MLVILTIRKNALLGLAIALLSISPFAQPVCAQLGAEGDLYVSSDEGDSVIQFDGATGVLVGTFASGGGLENAAGVVFNREGNLLVAGWRSNNVVEYDGVTGEFLRVFASGNGLDNPIGLTIHPNGNLLVGNFNNILEFDGTTGAYVGVFAVSPGFNEDVLFGPNGNLFVNANELGAPPCSLNVLRVIEFDGTTGDFIRVVVEVTSDICNNYFNGLEFHSNGNLLVSNIVMDEVTEFDISTGQFVRAFASTPGLRPVGLTYTSSGTLLVLSDAPNNSVEEFDPTTGAFIRTFASGGGLNRPYKMVFKQTVLGRLVNLTENVVSLNLANGISNSLDAKLGNSSSALDDSIDGNDNAAVQMLEAFINSVAAQAGNKIPVDDAADLIAEALVIIDLIKSQ